MPFPFAFAWLNDLQAVRHSHRPNIYTVRSHDVALSGALLLGLDVKITGGVIAMP
jgi:MFS family permease